MADGCQRDATSQMTGSIAAAQKDSGVVLGGAGRRSVRRVRHVLADGRTIGCRIFGDPHGAPVLALHGTPGSSLKFATADQEARQLGLALISVDRWGYGQSTAPRKPTLSRFADDVMQLMDALGFKRFAVLGVSGGGPFAVAVAAHAPASVTALALVAPVGEIAGLKIGQDGLGIFHDFCFRLLGSQPIAVRTVFLAFKALLVAAPTAAIRLATARACASDRRIMMEPTAARHLAASFNEGLVGSASGPALDMTLFRRRWDVDVASVKCRARVWIGDADRNVPRSAARALAARMPQGTLTVLADAGHYWIVANAAEVLEWIGAELRGTTAH